MSDYQTQRVRRLQELMKESGFDCLVCRLPENVVYITEYWPHHGISVSVLPKEGKPTVFIPEVEAAWGNPDWAEVVPFGWALLKDQDLYTSYRQQLTQIRHTLGLEKARIGVEKELEIVGTTYRHAEPIVPAAPWNSLLDEVFTSANLLDATELLQTAKLIKTPYDLERLRVANELAEIGIAKFLSDLQPGMREVEISALIEGTIRQEGAGYKGARLVWAEVEVASGAVNTAKANLLIPSTDRVIEEGDLVMVEMATVMDGYYSDLTYMAVAGEPSQRQREVHNAVLDAQQAASRQMVPGNSYADPDTAARKVLQDSGLGEYFVHVTGHGLGFRFHESTPFLMPGATGTLQEGIVSSVEPGVYITGFGGIRIEDNVAVSKDGPDFLSTPRLPW
ncbi:MAG: aminopeptidase P family protein [Chloroflexota bacterium]|nr:MAG: aminopeptidase P family protein [Chloroflexota bacterium]